MQVVIAWGVFIRQKELHKRDLRIRYSVQINWGCYSVAKNILPLYPITYSEVVREWINDTFQWYREKSLQYTLTASNTEDFKKQGAPSSSSFREAEEATGVLKWGLKLKGSPRKGRPVWECA